MIATGRGVLIAILLAAPAGAAKPYQTWGLPGVSMDQYRADAIACGRIGANTDISGEPSTQAFVAAENWADRNLNNPPAGVDQAREQAQMVGRLNPAKRLAEVQSVHVVATEACLTRLGYQRFTLTADQQRALRRLPIGSPARHSYLHALASDGAILAAQAGTR